MSCLICLFKPAGLNWATARTHLTESVSPTRWGLHLFAFWKWAKLKEVGGLYGASQSGVTQAARRFEEAMKKDSTLEKRVLEIARNSGLSIV